MQPRNRAAFTRGEKKPVHIRGKERENKVESIEVLFHFRTAFPGGFDIVNAFVYSRFPQALLCTLLHVVCLTSWDIDLAGQLSVPVGALNSRRLSDRSMCLHQTVDTNSPSNERIDETAFYSPVSYPERYKNGGNADRKPEVPSQPEVASQH